MKPVTKVFLVIAVLVLAFLLWSLFFNNGGILQTGYNSLADAVNNTWGTITGSSNELLPDWGGAGVDTEGQNLDNVDSGF